MVIWLMVFPGRQDYDRKRGAKIMEPKWRKAVLVDGDAFREIMGDDLGHSMEDRRKNAGRISRLCKLLDDQKIDVVCCILSILRNRENGIGKI